MTEARAPWRLYHWRFDPFSRQIRLALAEKGLRVRLVEERVWDGRQGFLALNPAGATPVLVAGRAGARRLAIVGCRAGLEFLEDTEPAPPLLPADPGARAEARRLADWFDRKFDSEVNAFLLYELVERRITRQGGPDLALVAGGEAALRRHVAYVGQLAQGRGWLAGDAFTIADVAAAGHLSCVDALGRVDWDAAPAARGWWTRVRARPAYQALHAAFSAGFDANETPSTGDTDA